MPRYITKEGLEKLKKELAELKNVKRKEAIERIQKAKELGDLTENAEYSDAKDEQGFIEGRILELENIIKDTVIIEPCKTDEKIVSLGCIVKVKYDDKEKEYFIVGPEEANPQENKISYESPLGQGFLDKKVGDIVKVQAPKGEMDYEVLEIKYPKE